MNSGFISKLLHGSFWSVIAKWTINLLGIISTIVLARILTPFDFGLVATAALVTSFFDLFSRIGTEQYLIHKETLTQEDINTAWTIQVLIKIAIATLLFIASFFVSDFFQTQGLEDAVRALALVPVLIAGENIGQVLLKKEMKFKKIMLLQSIAKLISFIFTIIIALIYQNYWAFIIGTLINHVVITLGSYYISTYRPTYCLNQIKQQWSFSQWTLLKGFVNYTNGKIDQLLITSSIGVKELGQYNMAQRIKNLPLDIVVSPITDAIFPALAQEKSTEESFREKTQKSLFLILFLTTPICVCVAVLSNPLVELFLGGGEKWQFVQTILPLLSPLIIFGTFIGNIFGIFTILGKTKFLFFFEAISATLSTFLLYMALSQFDIETLVLTKSAISLISCIILVTILANSIKLSLKRLLTSFIITAIFNLITYGFISQIIHYIGKFDYAISNLTVYGTALLMVYIFTTTSCIVMCKSINEDFAFLHGALIQSKKQFIRKVRL